MQEGTALEFGDGLIDESSEFDDRERTDAVACDVEGCMRCTDLYPDADIDTTRRSEFVQSDLGARVLESHKQPEEEQMLLLPMRLYGYALTDRKWHALHINKIEDVAHEGAAVDGPMTSFRDLVLDPSHKKLIEALVKNQIRDSTERGGSSGDSTTGPQGPPPSLDFIRGKGRGLIMLLHGVSRFECIVLSSMLMLYCRYQG